MRACEEADVENVCVVVVSSICVNLVCGGGGGGGRHEHSYRLREGFGDGYHGSGIECGCWGIRRETAGGEEDDGGWVPSEVFAGEGVYDDIGECGHCVGLCRDVTVCECMGGMGYVFRQWRMAMHWQRCFKRGVSSRVMFSLYKVGL